jgi:hypothetical protein
MQRSLYPEGAEVHQRHLVYTESTKIAAIDQSLVDETSRGVVSGLGVTVNATTNTLVDVALGYGYAPNGEYTPLATTQRGLSLANYTLSALNYVLLVYDELQSQPEAYEADGTTRQTKVTLNPRVVILQASDYAALPATNPILTSNSVDRSILLAIVTANGPAIALTGGSIQGPSVFQPALQVTQPINVSGVSILFVDPNTVLGSGILSFTAGVLQLTWQAPGDSSPGSAVTVSSAASTYVLTSSGGRTITVNVSVPLLPTSNKSDTLTVSNLYNQVVTRFTDQDFQHRSMIGSGIPNTKNPHGMTQNDLSPGSVGTLQTHQDVEHVNGLAPGSSSNLLQVSVFTPPAPDQLNITNFATGDIAYVNGNLLTALNPSQAPVVTFLDGITNGSTYGVYLNQDGTLSKSIRATWQTGSTLNTVMQVVNASPGVSGSVSISWTSGAVGAANLTSAGSAALSPTYDTLIRFWLADEVNYFDLWVKGSNTFGSTQSETITFTSEPVGTVQMPLAFVPWSGSSTGFLGYGFGTANSPNLVFDRRQFGNTAAINVRSDAGFTNPAQANFELHGDGVWARYNTPNVFIQVGTTPVQNNAFLEFALGTYTGTSTPPTQVVLGGPIYVGGKRFDVPTTTVSLTASAANIIYVDQTGTMRVSTLSLSQLQAAQQNQPYVLINTVTLNGAGPPARTSTLDQRIFTGQIKNQPYGAVGLDANACASINSIDLTEARVSGSLQVGGGPQSLSNVGGGSAIQASGGLGGVTGGVGGTAVIAVGGNAAGGNGFGGYGIIINAGNGVGAGSGGTALFIGGGSQAPNGTGAGGATAPGGVGIDISGGPGGFTSGPGGIGIISSGGGAQGSGAGGHGIRGIGGIGASGSNVGGMGVWGQAGFGAATVNNGFGVAGTGVSASLPAITSITANTGVAGAGGSAGPGIYGIGGPSSSAPGGYFVGGSSAGSPGLYSIGGSAGGHGAVGQASAGSYAGVRGLPNTTSTSGSSQLAMLTDGGFMGYTSVNFNSTTTYAYAAETKNNIVRWAASFTTVAYPGSGTTTVTIHSGFNLGNGSILENSAGGILVTFDSAAVNQMSSTAYTIIASCGDLNLAAPTVATLQYGSRATSGFTMSLNNASTGSALTNTQYGFGYPIDVVVYDTVI